MKKILSIVLAFIMLLSMSTVALGASNFYEEALFDIASLGLFIPDENGSYNTDKPLTRAEFATVILRLTQHNDIGAVDYGQNFSDVEKGAWYYSAVQTATAFGYMQGDAEGTFRPNDNVSFQEAVKVLVSVLGYDTEAAKYGGYPGGYMTIGSKLRIMNKVSMGEEFTRGDFAVMLYNALDTELLVPVYGTKEGYINDGTTYRYLLMRAKGNKVYNVTGIITASGFSYLEFPIRDLKRDEVVINNVRCKVGNTNAADYIGMEVEIFAAEDETGIVTLCSVKPTRSNTVTKILLTDISGCSNSTVSYMESGKTKEEKLDFETMPIMLYNGIPIDFDKDELLTGASGDAVFVDNDGNGDIDVVFINTYENALIQRVAENVLVPYNGFTINGQNSFFYDKHNNAKLYEFYNMYGEEIEFSDIEADQMISVYSDKGGSRFRVYVADEYGTGKFTGIDRNQITVGAKTYNTYAQTVFAASMGDDVELYTDYLGYAAYVKRSATQSNYAYVMGVSTKGFSDGQIKLLLSKNVSFSADVNTEDADNVTSKPVLICENEGILICDLAKKIRVDGTRYEAHDAAGMLSIGDVIKYTIDADGNFSGAEHMSMYAGHETTKLKYSIYERVFGQNAYIQGFSLDEASRIICLPTGGGSDDDYMVRTRIDESGNTEGYLVQAYDYNEETKNAGLVVVTKAMDADFVGTVGVKSSAACMVADISKLINEKEEPYYRLTLVEGSKKVEYLTTTVKSGNRVFDTLRAGDLISYYMNDNDLIENVMILHSFADGDGEYDINHGDYSEYCGTATEVSFDEIDNAIGRKVTRLGLNINGGGVEILVQQRNKPPVFMYYSDNSENIYASSLEEIVVGYDKVYVMTLPESNGETTRAVVIVRGE